MADRSKSRRQSRSGRVGKLGSQTGGLTIFVKSEKLILKAILIRISLFLIIIYVKMVFQNVFQMLEFNPVIVMII